MKGISLVLLALTFVLTSCSSMTDSSTQTPNEIRGVAEAEIWKDRDLKFVVRDNNGRFDGIGFIKLESWNDGDDVSEWVVRRSNGTFVTSLKGRLEKWDLGKKANETDVIVFRDNSGQFVTWAPVEDYIEEGWETWDQQGENTTVYVVRFAKGHQGGRLINWSKPKLEDWRNFRYPVMVARDTNDGRHNGKILSWLPAKKVGNGYQYQNKNGQFLPYKNLE